MQMPYENSTTTTVLPDTIFTLPQQNIPNTNSLFNKADDYQAIAAVREWFFSPQTLFMYRIGRRTALVTRLSAQLPVTRLRPKETLAPQDAQTLQFTAPQNPHPVRHRFLMASFGINFRF